MLYAYPVDKEDRTSVKPDISPAEPPANYPANPSAGDIRPKNHDIRLLPSLR